MSYNILTGGHDDYDFGRLAMITQVIRRERPDLLILNECNLFEHNGAAIQHQLERALGMRGFLALAKTGFHVAAFVRDWDVVQCRVEAEWPHHAAIRLYLERGGTALTLIGAHLCPFGGTNRLCEAQFLANFARDEDFVLLAGDMNSISPADVEYAVPNRWPPRRLARHTRIEPGPEPPASPELDTRAIATLQAAGFVDLQQRSGKPFEATALTPLRSDWQDYQLRIDYLLASPPLAERLEAYRVVKDELTGTASDHYPLVADFSDI